MTAPAPIPDIEELARIVRSGARSTAAEQIALVLIDDEGNALIDTLIPVLEGIESAYLEKHAGQPPVAFAVLLAATLLSKASSVAVQTMRPRMPPPLENEGDDLPQEHLERSGAVMIQAYDAVIDLAKYITDKHMVKECEQQFKKTAHQVLALMDIAARRDVHQDED